MPVCARSTRTNRASNSTVTRDYQFEVERGEDGKGPVLLSIFGGKLTTYRKLAEHALEKLGAPGGSWTAETALPGGEIDPEHFDRIVDDQRAMFPWLTPEHTLRLARAYGTRMIDLLGDAQGMNDLGEHLGGDLYMRASWNISWTKNSPGQPRTCSNAGSKLYLHLDETGSCAGCRVVRCATQR